MVAENAAPTGSIRFHFDNYVVCVDGMAESGGANLSRLSELYD